MEEIANEQKPQHTSKTTLSFDLVWISCRSISRSLNASVTTTSGGAQGKQSFLDFELDIEITMTPNAIRKCIR